MKILMVIERYNPIWGGAENQLAQLCAFLARDGYAVSVVTRRWERGMPARDIIDGIPVHRIGLSFGGVGGSVVFAAALFRYLLWNGRKADIIHSHGAAILGGLCALSARLTGSRSVAKIATAGRIVSLNSNVFGRIVLALLRWVDVVICLSEEIYTELRRVGISEGQVARIPNAVDTDRFVSYPLERRTSWRRTQDIEPGAPLVLFSGRLVSRKGADILLEAWRRVTKRWPAARLMFLGDGRGQVGSVEEQLRLKIERENIANVTIVGAVCRPEDFLGNADIFVLPSLREGFPNALLEGMSAGLATVSSRIGGVVDLIKEGETGLLFSPGDADGLAIQIDYLLANPEIRREIGARAREQVIATYGHDKVFGRYRAIYGALGRTGTPFNTATESASEET